MARGERGEPSAVRCLMAWPIVPSARLNVLNGMAYCVGHDFASVMIGSTANHDGRHDSRVCIRYIKGSFHVLYTVLIRGHQTCSWGLSRAMLVSKG